MVDLDTWGWQEEKKPEPGWELDIVHIENTVDQTTQINKSLSTSLKEEFVTFLRRNVDVFAWIAADMADVDLELMFH